MLGWDIVNTVRIENHDAFDDAKLVRVVGIAMVRKFISRNLCGRKVQDCDRVH